MLDDPFDPDLDDDVGEPSPFFMLFFIITMGLILIVFCSCASNPISPDKKCKNTNLAGLSWSNIDVTNVLTFNDDCTGVVQMCNKYFTYEVIDFNTVYINVDTTSVVGSYGARINHDCPNKAGVYKCIYSLTHLTESNMEVMDINCAWNNFKMEQLTRYEK